MAEHTVFNRAKLQKTLSKLRPDSLPLWGILTAQHMVEHLAETIRFSNGKKTVPLAIPEDKAERAKLR